MTSHLTTAQLEKGLEHIRQSPKDNGLLEMIVARPDSDKRKVLQEGYLDTKTGLVGDNWSIRGSSKTADGNPHPEMQLNLMNSRCIALLAQNKERWPLAGDQLFIDINLSDENLMPGSQLSIGEAIIEVMAIPHNGCKKFAERFGVDSTKFVNSLVGKELHLRGINAKVIKSGVVKVGDIAKKVV